MGRLGLESGSVDVVAEQRLADGGQVDADLMGAPVSSRQDNRLATVESSVP